jgi:chromosome segregation ATPase
MVQKTEPGEGLEDELRRVRAELAQMARDRDMIAVSHQATLHAFEKHRRANMEYKNWENKIRQDLNRAMAERDAALKERTAAIVMNNELGLQHKDLTKRHVDTVTEITMQRDKLAQSEARYNDLMRHLEGLRRQIATLQSQLFFTYSEFY